MRAAVQPRELYNTDASLYQKVFFCFIRFWLLSPVRLSSVTLVHHTQAVEIFGNILRHLLPWPSVDIHRKFYEDGPRGTLHRRS